MRLIKTTLVPILILMLINYVTLQQQAVDVTAQIYAERSQQTKKEKDHTSEQPDSFCYKIPVQNHFPECTELYYDICRCIFCQSDPVIRLDVQSALSSL